MKNRLSVVAFLVVMILLTTLSCNLPMFAKAPGSGGVGVETAAAATVMAFNTQAAFGTLVSPFTATPQGTTNGGEFPGATITAVPPTVTSVPPTAMPSATPQPCNRVEFVKDVTISDGTVFYPEENFTKTWRLRNSGTCTWAPDYSVVFFNGNAMHSTASVPLNQTVSPGGTVDISLRLRAPEDAGNHTGEWKLSTNNGLVFGMGTGGDKPFWVKIVVKDRPDLDGDHPGDFALNYQSARWESSTGVVTCPSLEEDYKNGSVFHSDGPRLEGGYQDDEAAIVLIPSDGSGGMIAGHYPPIKVSVGNDFSALVGCMYDSPDCDVIFELSYQVDGGAETSLGTWPEKSEGQYTNILLDLNVLDGKEVEFILKVHSNGSSKDDRVFWLAPRIK